jgi:hypothetical protein
MTCCEVVLLDYRPQLLSGFLVNGYLHRVSHQSHLSANDKGDNEVIPGLCIDLLAFTLQLKNPEKSHLGDRR